MDQTLSQILDMLFGLNTQVTQLKAQVEADVQQIAALTAERDALKTGADNAPSAASP